MDKVGNKNMLYARTKRDAKKYINSNFRGFKVEVNGIECQCGETEGMYILDDDYNVIKKIAICNSCWCNHTSAERIEAEGTLDEDELLGILTGFEKDLYDVEIIQMWDINDDADFILAKLEYEDDDYTVPIIHIRGKEWVFTPRDWQGYMPTNPDEIEEVQWRVNNTETEGIIIDGMPRIISWNFNQEEVMLETRERIGRELREAREKAGLTLRQLAEKVGIAYNHISRIESGRYNVNLDTITAISAALGKKIKIN